MLVYHFPAVLSRTVCAIFKEIVLKRLILSAGYDKINLRKDLIVNER